MAGNTIYNPKKSIIEKMDRIINQMIDMILYVAPNVDQYEL